jgi:hypothetical protein
MQRKRAILLETMSKQQLVFDHVGFGRMGSRDYHSRKEKQNEVDEVLNNLNNLKTLFSCFVGVLPKRNMKKYSMCTLPEDGA